jgi:outer membrane lipoprotein-sorting protein
VRRWAGLALVLLVAQSTPGASVPGLTSPLGILKDAISAPETLDYEGTKVIVTYRGKDLEAITVAELHKRPYAYRMEYLSPEGIAGRILVDTGEESWHYEPSVHLVVRGPSLGRRNPEELNALPENYHVRLLGIERVIGRPAYLIDLVPKAEGVQRRFWIDRATGLILAWQESDAERGVFFASTFTRIAFTGDLPAAMFRFRPPARARVVDLRAEGVRLVRLSELAQRVGFHPVAAADVPPGYRYQGGGISRFGGLGAVVLRYGDGASTVSLFQVPVRRMAFPPGGEVVRFGELEARLYPFGYFRALMWERGGILFAAVGSVPLATLAAFARGTDPSGEEQRIWAAARATGLPRDRIQLLRDRGATFDEILRTSAGRGAGSTPSLVEVVERFHDQIRLEGPRR